MSRCIVSVFALPHCRKDFRGLVGFFFNIGEEKGVGKD